MVPGYTKALPVPGKGAAIVYCYSQKECEDVSEALQSWLTLALTLTLTLTLALILTLTLTLPRYSSAAYHAGLEEQHRQEVQDRWSMGAIQVICATIAFGLGINMPTVRFVL